MHLYFFKTNVRMLFPVIMLIMVLINSSVAEELEYAYMHFPPYQYNKELSTPDHPGINLEIHQISNSHSKDLLFENYQN